MKFMQGRQGIFTADVQQIRGGDSRQSIVYIVTAGHFQRHLLGIPAGTVQQEGGVALLILGNVAGIVVTAAVMTVGDNPAGQALGQFLPAINVAADYQGAILGQQPGKVMEGMTDGRQVFEKVQMILFHVQNQGDLGKEA